MWFPYVLHLAYVDCTPYAPSFQCNYDASILFFQMALSAGTPILRGYLSDLDCRWSVIAGGVDDRTPEERGLEVSHVSLVLSIQIKLANTYILLEVSV